MTVSGGYWCLRTMTDVHEKPREESVNIGKRPHSIISCLLASFFLDTARFEEF